MRSGNNGMVGKEFPMMRGIILIINGQSKEVALIDVHDELFSTSIAKYSMQENCFIMIFMQF